MGVFMFSLRGLRHFLFFSIAFILFFQPSLKSYPYCPDCSYDSVDPSSPQNLHHDMCDNCIREQLQHGDDPVVIAQKVIKAGNLWKFQDKYKEAVSLLYNAQPHKKLLVLKTLLTGLSADQPPHMPSFLTIPFYHVIPASFIIPASLDYDPKLFVDLPAEFINSFPEQQREFLNVFIELQKKILTYQKFDTPSGHHARNYFKEIACFCSLHPLHKNNLLQASKNISLLMTFIDRLYKKEFEEQASGRYTFVHAQQWHWHFESDIFQKLYEIKYKTNIENYRFLRFEEPKWDQLYDEVQKRKKILSDGGCFIKQPNLLFMNHAIFGNMNYSGSCSMYYWLQGMDFSQEKISLATLFESFGLKKYLNTYQNELFELEQLHKESNFNGNLLLLSFTPEQLKNSVYLAHPRGPKRRVIINGQETDDIQLILDTLRTCPEAIKYRKINAKILEKEYGDVQLISDTFRTNPESVKFDRWKIKILVNGQKTEDIQLILNTLQMCPESVKYCEVHTKVLVNGQETDDIRLISETIRACQENHEPIQVREHCSDPHEFCSVVTSETDSFEYCLVLTHDLALNPQKGPRIFSFNTADPEKFHLYGVCQ